jgi:SAM-dependent methyltransferase
VSTVTADPGAIWRVIQGGSLYWALVAAVRLGVLDQFDGPKTTGELAAACGAEIYRLQAVLDALGVAGLLDRDGQHWRSTAASDAFLRTDSPNSMADLVEWSPGWPENWPHLDATVRGELPPRAVDADAAFYDRLVLATFPTQEMVARLVAATLDPPGPAPRILDFGAGAAPWSIALLDAWPGARATVNDLADVVDVARRMATERGVVDRCEFVAGDYLEVPLAAGPYDVVVLGHVCRAEGPDRARALIRRAADALAPGGCIVVVDYVVDDDRAGPVNALLLGLTMVANTIGGRAYTRSELTGWLTEVGLGNITSTRPAANTDVMLARKEIAE